MKKDELLKTIQTKYRQLNRYLFYFEKNSEGVFVATNRPKFGINEMKQPGVFGNWSLNDLLSHLIYWQQLFLQLYHGQSGDDRNRILPAPNLSWDDLVAKDSPLPEFLDDKSIRSVLKQIKISHEQIVSIVELLSEEALFTPRYFPWTDDAPVANYIELFTFHQYDWIKKHVRRWRKSHAGNYLNKKIILDRIQTERKRLEKNLTQLTPDQMIRPEVIGEWSVKDILAHLMDWEQRFLGWYQAGLHGELPEVPAPGIGWDQLELLNQQIYEKYRDYPLEDVLRDFDDSYEQVLTMVKDLPENEFFSTGIYAWLGNNNMVEVILANTVNHYRWAKNHIRNWLKDQGEL
jgi:hypothetical protein